MTDLATLLSGKRDVFNPYDFTGPVRSGDLFAGRSRELRDAIYYLNEARRPIGATSLFVSGARAAGKTSFLNIIQEQAEKSGYPTARVNLTERDATPLAFAFKIYDAILNCAFKQGSFGGRGSHTAKSYARVVHASANQTQDDLGDLIFPYHYAAASQGNREFSEIAFEADLRYISAELEQPCIVLFDECNVLQADRSNLQMLRNVFGNLPGYMLILAGTPDVLPAIDQVFSPLARGFKRLELAPYKSLEDTQACLANPLRAMGLDVDALLRSNFSLIPELHEVTGGRPYEIQLVCHHMFKRVQEKSATDMFLSLEVLGAVLNELAGHQQSSRHDVIQQLRTLSDRDIRALGILTECRATLPELFEIHRCFDESPLTLEELQEKLDSLTRLGLLEQIEGGVVVFRGDDFAETYTRYLAATRGIALTVTHWGFENELGYRLERIFTHRGVGGSATLLGRRSGQAARDLKVEFAIRSIARLQDDTVILTEVPEVVADAYRTLLTLPEGDDLAFTSIDARLANHSAGIDIVMPASAMSDLLNTAILSRVLEGFEQMGGELVFTTDQVTVPDDVPALLEQVEGAASPQQAKMFSAFRVSEALAAYSSGLHELALGQATRAFALDPDAWSGTTCAHLSLFLKRFLDAEEYASSVIDMLGSGDDQVAVSQQAALAHYDRAIARLMTDNSQEGVRDLERAEAIATESDGNSILMIPSGHALEEVTNITVTAAAFRVREWLASQ